jgi:hypothetical protein
MRTANSNDEHRKVRRNDPPWLWHACSSATSTIGRTCGHLKIVAHRKGKDVLLFRIWTLAGIDDSYPQAKSAPVTFNGVDIHQHCTRLAGK